MNLDIYKECLHYQYKIKKKSAFFQEFPMFIRQKLLGKFEIPYIEFFITTECNLKCEHCSNLIPFIEKKEHIAFSEFKLDLDVLLSKIDRLYRLKLHGGEVFLHPELCEMVDYADSLKKIKSIRVATNGTVIPSEEVLKVLAASKAVVQISDYPAFSGKAEKIAELFRMYGVKYVKLTGQKWRDMGEIKKRETNRFKSCSITRCTSLYRGKIYVCSRAAMMEELGCHFYDGIDIASDKRTLRRDILRIYNGERCKACFYCDGDTDFAEEIPAGKQLL